MTVDRATHKIIINLSTECVTDTNTIIASVSDSGDYNNNNIGKSDSSC